VPVVCPGSPLLGVYHPWRLQVLGSCRSFRGVVTSSRLEADGDHHVDIRPDAGFGRYLDAANRTVQHGALVVEIVPGQRMPIPSPGDRVIVFGTWVRDLIHGWNEIHPVWWIAFVDTGLRRYALPPVPPRYTGTSLRGATHHGGYLPPPHDYDCADFPTQRAAQRYFDRYPGDPSHLDGDHNGVACEGNP
jgi:hypothetical protein